MNSYSLKLTKTVEVPEALDLGHDYVFGGRMAVTSIEKIDSEDGSFEFLHKGRLTHVEVVNKLGVTLKAVAKGSKSQVLRLKIQERGLDYDETMGKLLDRLDDVLDLLNSRKF